MDKKFAITGLIYASLGMILGIYMAATHNHSQRVTHAHIMLLGFVVTFVYAVCHKLWLNNTNPNLARIQFYCHQLGSLTLLSGLYFLYGTIVPPAKLEPLLSVGSLATLLALLIMIFLLIRSPSFTSDISANT
jgi:predicted transporter